MGYCFFDSITINWHTICIIFRKIFKMKNLGLIIAFVTLSGFANAQVQDPDQNPNYMQSAQKYADNRDALLANQGKTVQDTYVAFDWSTFKADRRQARINNRQAVRLARANAPIFYGRPFYGGFGFNNFGYPNYGFNSFGYQNNCFNPGFGTGFLLGAGTSHFLFH